MTWGQIKTVIDGLWSALVDDAEYQYTSFKIYNEEVRDDRDPLLGWGAIVETDANARTPLFDVPTMGLSLNSTSTKSLSTSKRALRISPELLPALNASSPS